MVTVKVYRKEEGKIAEIEIEGHAGYAPSGQDLVCAGISAVTIGMANAIHQLFGVDPVRRMGKSGFLHFHLPEGITADVEGKIHLLLEAMLLSLRSLEDSYGKYIRVIEEMSE